MKPWASLLVVIAALAVGHSQTKTPRPSTEIHGIAAYERSTAFAQLGKVATNSLSAATVNAGSINSLPLWGSSFKAGDDTYSFVMVGSKPSQPTTTSIGTVIIPLNFVFTEWRNSAGHLITLNGDSVVSKVKASPVFVAGKYADGEEQFGDAIQRANFWNVSSPQWHTHLYSSSVQTPITITVPVGAAELFKMPNGTLAAAIDSKFLDAALNAQLSTRTLKPNQLPILLARNILIYSGNPNNCCILGFHTAFDNGSLKQTLAYASWLDPSISINVFGDPSIADTTPLTHEIAEWLMDPLLTNVVPSWRPPDTPAGMGCSNILEPGDPIEVLHPSGVAVYANGVKYHVQTEALLPWFEDQSASAAFSHAYSFPNMTLLTTHADPCN